MKTLFKIFFFLVVLVGVGGYAAWHFGTNAASEKIIETVEANLDNQNLQEVKSYIQNDPMVQQIVSEAAATDPETLPFQTKEEATRIIIKKVGVGRLLDIKEQAQNGGLNKDEILAEIEGKLTEDEIFALKYVLYQELNNLN